MTFGEILAATYDDLSINPATPSVVVNRIKRWVNEGHRHLLRDPANSDLRSATITFSSVADQAVQALPQAFERLDAIIQTSNNVRLEMRTRDWMRTVDPGENSTGNPEIWAPWGYVPVQVQPDSTGVWAVSDSASDTGQTVYLRGVRENGDQQAVQSAVLTGTSRVAIGSAITDWTVISAWNISGVAAGTVTLYDAASSGNVLARIPIGSTSVSYDSIRFWPIPAEVLTYTADGQREVQDLIRDSDVPMLPTSFHDMLGVYARLRSYKRDGDESRTADCEIEWREWLGKLQSFVQYPPDYRPVSGRLAEGMGWSDLGGAYPIDRWLA